MRERFLRRCNATERERLFDLSKKANGSESEMYRKRPLLVRGESDRVAVSVVFVRADALSVRL